MHSTWDLPRVTIRGGQGNGSSACTGAGRTDGGGSGQGCSAGGGYARARVPELGERKRSERGKYACDATATWKAVNMSVRLR
eukprot:3135004-Pleurochrysis_carterae.AAC.1